MLSSLRSLALVLASCGIAYAIAKTIPPVHRANVSIVLLRPMLELPDFKPEAMLNRWAWARDGMALQEGLLSDQLLTQVLTEIPALATDLRGLRRMIDVNFAGAESQLYTIRMDHPTPEAALGAVQFMSRAFKEIHRATWLAPLEAAVAALDEQIAAAGPKADRSALLRARAQLHTQVVLQQSDQDRQFRLVSAPRLEPEPIWPKPRMLVALGFIVGIGLAIGVELARRHTSP
jgi:hypothetical protein